MAGMMEERAAGGHRKNGAGGNWLRTGRGAGAGYGWAMMERTAGRALIFDFDGLIADTESAIYVAWRELYESQGHELPLATYVQCVGSTFHTYDPMAVLEEKVGAPIHWEPLLAKKDKRIKALHAELQPFPGVQPLLEAARAAGVPCAVASSSTSDWVLAWLSKFGLVQYFDQVRCRNHVPRAKPAPDLFLSAAETVGRPPARCVVLEDSRNGLIAAQAAGAPCVIVPNMVTSGSDFTGAHRIIESLEALSLEELLHPL